MKLLLDTHILIWTAKNLPKVSALARSMIGARDSERFFSVGSLWEVAIKAGLGRADFVIDASALRRGLLVNGYQELAVLAPHALFVSRLPPIHKDPFDRLLVAQAMVEGLTLLTSDDVVASYSAAIIRV